MKGVLHVESFAKYAQAFFRMSRSIFRRATSARSLDNSICSALTGFVPAPPSLPSCSALYQWEIDCAGTSNVVATAATL